MKLSDIKKEMEAFFRKTGNELAVEIIEMIDYIFDNKVKDDIILNRIKMLYLKIKRIVVQQPKERPLSNNSFLKVIDDNVNYFKV